MFRSQIVCGKELNGVPILLWLEGTFQYENIWISLVPTYVFLYFEALFFRVEVYFRFFYLFSCAYDRIYRQILFFCGGGGWFGHFMSWHTVFIVLKLIIRSNFKGFVEIFSQWHFSSNLLCANEFVAPKSRFILLEFILRFSSTLHATLRPPVLLVVEVVNRVLWISLLNSFLTVEASLASTVPGWSRHEYSWMCGQ